MKRKMVSALLCATMVAGMVVVPAATAQAADKKLIGVTHADQGSPEMEPGWR
mgnify:CR=1 FL=1